MKIRLLLSLAIIIFFLGCAKKTPEQKLEEALTSLRNQDMLGAIIKLKNITKEHQNTPAAAQAFFFLGGCYEMQGDLDEARKNYDEAIKKVSHGDPIGQQAFQMKIGTYMKEKKYDEAAEELKSVIGKIPEGSGYQRDLKFGLATVYFEKKDFSAGIELLDPYIYSDKDTQFSQEAIQIITQYYMQDKQYKEAIDFIDVYLEKKPESKLKNLLNITKGYFYQLNEDKDNAIKFFQIGEEGYKKDIQDTLDVNEKVSLNFELARSYELRDEFDKAIDVYNKLVKESQDERVILNSYFSINNNLIRQRKLDEALKILDDIERQFPTVQNAISEVQQRRMSIKKLKEAPKDVETSPTVEKAKEIEEQKVPTVDNQTKKSEAAKKVSNKTKTDKKNK